MGDLLATKAVHNENLSEAIRHLFSYLKQLL